MNCATYRHKSISLLLLAALFAALCALPARAAAPQAVAPGVVYSALIGGSGAEEGRAVAVDAQGNVYITGTTLSNNFPSAGAPQPNYGGPASGNFGDAFVAKLNPAGDQLIYMTYLGGSGADIGEAITVDADGSVYVTGMTESPNFPTTAGALQPSRPAQNCGNPPCADAFVAKLNPSGSALVFSTYLGGDGEENAGLLDTGTRSSAAGIAVDAQHNVYVTGTTQSANFPVHNAAYGDRDGAFDDIFVAKLNPEGSALLYGTYLGGDGAEYAGDVAVDDSGNAFVTGGTLANNFPITNALQTAPGSVGDAVVAQIDTTKAASASLRFSTYLGGGDADYGLGIALDSQHNIVVAGHTQSLDFPVKNAYQATNGGAGGTFKRDVFVTQLSPTGGAVLYSTYLGGSSDDVGYDLAIDGQDNVYVTGTTSSDNFPVRSAWQPERADFRDTFAAKLAPSSGGDASLVYSSFYGSVLNDYSYGIAVDGSGDAYMTGIADGVIRNDLPIDTVIGNNNTGAGVLVAKFGELNQFKLYMPNVNKLLGPPEIPE